MKHHASITPQRIHLIGRRWLCIVTYTTVGTLAAITLGRAIIFQGMDLEETMVVMADTTKPMNLIF